jgi:hypothetical protein
MTPPLVRPSESDVSEPHRIRLRGPWEFRLHTRRVSIGWMNVPGTLHDAGWAGYIGMVSFYRRFGRPSNLGTGDRVRLAFEGVTGTAEVCLNEEPIGVLAGSGSFDVSGRLRERNMLALVMAAIGDECGIVRDVVLEIEAIDPAPATRSSQTGA